LFVHYTYKSQTNPKAPKKFYPFTLHKTIVCPKKRLYCYVKCKKTLESIENIIGRYFSHVVFLLCCGMIFCNAVVLAQTDFNFDFDEDVPPPRELTPGVLDRLQTHSVLNSSAVGFCCLLRRI
jgi:hypothetical protein